jgi:hypothetical protein
MEPSPAVRKRGFGPVAVVPRTEPVAASMLVISAPSARVSQSVPPLKSGL